ncbi:MAG: DUF2281 domain-containing protein [candidate division KSB1 bacterium]|nr:DUF2281 domain-containing protein [candidate division KSB1 bacterium]MDZ7366894.1 DUF2281 domain-containing protein [candidate division KSB1 bacterium]MDZ7406063.1 DUF2281 domain-containing protein [candidate division KSB1 bacterium]
MQAITIPQIVERLQKLPMEKLAVVFDFVSFLTKREQENDLTAPYSDAFQTMLASEAVLRRDWDRPEEDEAWADL